MWRYSEYRMVPETYLDGTLGVGGPNAAGGVDDTELGSFSLKLLELEVAPFTGRTDAIGDLRERIKEWLVQNTVRRAPWDAIKRWAGYPAVVAPVCPFAMFG